jgi:transcriptional repressor NrdR
MVATQEFVARLVGFAMKCPICGIDNDRVIDSRASHDGFAIRRRRECLGCQARYNTYERVDDPMKCPFCHGEGNRVVETIPGEGGFAVRRQRECLTCRRQYATFERSEERTIKVVKKDGTRAPFDRQKIRQGLEKACWKRPIGDEQINAIVDAIESDIHARSEPEVESAYLGELAMQHLRKLDQVAFVRFASVYRQFQDVQDFVDELSR